MNLNSSTNSSTELFTKVQASLNEAKSLYDRGTNNQLGMSGHYRTVADTLESTKDLLTRLQEQLRAEANELNESFFGGRRKRKATRRRTRR